MVDSKMPNVDGFELLKSIAIAMTRPAILMLTSDELTRASIGWRGAGLCHYLVNPARRPSCRAS